MERAYSEYVVWAQGVSAITVSLYDDDLSLVFTPGAGIAGVTEEDDARRRALCERLAERVRALPAEERCIAHRGQKKRVA